MTRRGVGAMAVWLLTSLCAYAPLAQAQIPPEDRPLVVHKVVLQITDDDAVKQTMILNNAENVMKALGEEKTAVEIVAFGPGIQLLRDDNPNAEHIRALKAKGVIFDACQNTINGIERSTGKPFPLNPQARRVPAGIAQIVTLVEHGYVLVRP